MWDVSLLLCAVTTSAHISELDQHVSVRAVGIRADGSWNVAADLGTRRDLPLCSTMPRDKWQVNSDHGIMYTTGRSGCWVEWPNNQSHALGPQHHMADVGIVHELDRLLHNPGAHNWHSINDIGCGLGQLGHALLARDAKHRYWCCDSDSSAKASRGFVHSCGEQEAPLADWVASFEVAEHIPRNQVVSFLASLHRANCRGIILSWAAPGQGGHGHVNEQWAKIYVPKVEALGYAANRELTQRFRTSAALAWLSHKRNCSALRGQACSPVMGDQLVVFDRVAGSACKVAPDDRTPAA